MDKKSKIIFKEWAFIILAWIGSLYFLVFISYWGIRHLLKENAITEYVDSAYIHLEILMTAIIFGTLFAVINTITDTTQMRKRSFGAIILLRSALYFISFLFVVFIIYFVFDYFGIFTQKEWVETSSLFTPIYVISFISYFVAMIFFLNFIVQVNRKFGRGNLLKLLLGKYHIPKNEEHAYHYCRSEIYVAPHDKKKEHDIQGAKRKCD